MKEPKKNLEHRLLEDSEHLIHRIEAGAVILILLVLIAALGIGIMNFKARTGVWYWLGAAPVYAGINIYLSWSKVRKRGESEFKLIRNQVIHWSAFLGAIYLIYYLHQEGRMNYDDAGLVSILILSLATFLAGLDGDWRFCVLGVLLGFGVIGAAFFERYLWIIAFAILLGGIALVAWLLIRKKSRGSAPKQAAPLPPELPPAR